MPILREEVNGRLGSYDVVIFENDNPISGEEIDAELESDVIIEYGKLERSPYRQILKSYCSLSFVDEELSLHKRFRGGFDTEQYVLEIRGPNIKWKGFLKEENRTVPLTNRIQKERTVLRFYGGITEDRIKKRFTPDVDAENTYYLHDITNLVPVDTGSNLGSEIFESEFLRSNIEIQTATKDWLDVTNKKNSGIGVEEAQVIDMWANDNLYQATKNYLKLTGSILYKSLNSGNTVLDDCYLLGAPGTFKRRTAYGTNYYEKERQGFINVIQQKNIIKDEESGLKDLKRVGDLIVEFGSDDNIAGISSETNNASGTNIGYERYYTYGYDNTLYRGREPSSTLILDFSGNYRRNVFLGHINPTRPLGFVVEFVDIITGLNELDFTLIYNNANGDTASVSNPDDGDTLIGPKTTQEMNPELKCDANDEASVELKVKYIDSRDRIVENLIADVDKNGVEEIKIGEDVRNPTYVFSTFSTEQVYKVRNEDLGIESYRPFLFKASLERKYRPFSTQTLRGKFLGLYGPEYVHKIEEDDEVSYWIPTGLKCNLNTGITDVSLQEMPNHFLADENLNVGGKGSKIESGQQVDVSIELLPSVTESVVRGAGSERASATISLTPSVTETANHPPSWNTSTDYEVEESNANSSPTWTTSGDYETNESNVKEQGDSISAKISIIPSVTETVT